MHSRSLEIHPVYGAVPQDGELVQCGEVIGLSADSRHVVTAPIPGRVRLKSTSEEGTGRLYVEIVPEPFPENAVPA